MEQKYLLIARKRILGDFSQSEVKLTDEEVEKLTKFEYVVLYDNGLKNLSGGYANIQINDFDESELILSVRCGLQDDTTDETHRWKVRFDRKTLKTEEI